MSIQRHPVDSFDKTLNFWEEYPDYKVHPVFGDFWRVNKAASKLKESSLFMWALSLCYDRKSSVFSQPEMDKWEVVSEDLFGKKDVMYNAVLEPENCKVVNFVLGGTVQKLIHAFEESIDTPLGLSLRRLEKKLIERTDFMMDTPYSLDTIEISENNRSVTKKGTADQLDKMFTNTDKIVSLIQKALDELIASENAGTMKGNERESLSDGSHDM
jgi:hypothetical protein